MLHLTGTYRNEDGTMTETPSEMIFPGDSPADDGPNANEADPNTAGADDANEPPRVADDSAPAASKSKGRVTGKPAKATPKAPEPERFASYNETLERFVGGVYDTKAAAGKDEAAKAAKDAGHTVDVRGV